MKSARAWVSWVSDRGIGRPDSGKDISLTLRGVSVKWIVSSLLISLSRSAEVSFSTESPLPDARLVSDELRRRSEGESPGWRPMMPLSLVETWDVVEPAVTGRLSRELLKLSDRRDFGWAEETDVDGRGGIR